MAATNPGIVPKAGTAYDPQQLSDAAAGAGGAGVTLVGNRQGAHGPVAEPTSPFDAGALMMGIAGAKATGTQSANAGVHTVFPSQFVFPTTKYHNAARTRGMS